MMEYLTNPALSTLLGVLVGSGSLLFGNILTQHLSNTRAAKQWEREQIAKNTERALERDFKKAEELEALYHQCVGLLSIYISTIHPNSKISEADVSSLTKDVHTSLSKLAVIHPSETLLRALDSFLSYPEVAEASRIRKYILEIAKQDFSSKQCDSGDAEAEKNLNAYREISFVIDKEFQKSLMIQGVELPNTFKFKYRPQDLLPLHREKLLEIYFTTYRKIPDQASLVLPTKQAKATVVTYTKTWEAKVNPLHVGLEGVLEAWAADFDQSSQEARASLNSPS